MDKIFDFFIKNPILQIAHDIYIQNFGDILIEIIENKWILRFFLNKMGKVK